MGSWAGGQGWFEVRTSNALLVSTVLLLIIIPLHLAGQLLQQDPGAQAAPAGAKGPRRVTRIYEYCLLILLMAHLAGQLLQQDPGAQAAPAGACLCGRRPLKGGDDALKAPGSLGGVQGLKAGGGRGEGVLLGGGVRGFKQPGSESRCN